MSKIETLTVYRAGCVKVDQCKRSQFEVRRCSVEDWVMRVNVAYESDCYSLMTKEVDKRPQWDLDIVEEASCKGLVLSL